MSYSPPSGTFYIKHRFECPYFHKENLLSPGEFHAQHNAHDWTPCLAPEISKGKEPSRLFQHHHSSSICVILSKLSIRY